MSKFTDLYELKQTFTNEEEFSTWLHRSFHFYSKVFMWYEGEEYYCVYRFLLTDLEYPFNFFLANEEREQSIGNDFCKTRHDADIVWIHGEYLSYDRALPDDGLYDDVRCTVIVTSKEGHHVFQRKSYPKPASRN